VWLAACGVFYFAYFACFAVKKNAKNARVAEQRRESLQILIIMFRNMKNKLLLPGLFIFFLAVIFPVLHLHAQTPASKTNLSPGKFKRMMKKENTVVLDVRTAEEYQSGHIPGAINVDVQQEDFFRQINALDKDRTYLIYCRSGKRSARALDILQQNGFRKSFHLKGGILKWPYRTQ
jgi:rhodanese-related sulfurtransferase